MIDFSLIESDPDKVEYLQSIGNYIKDGQITPELISEALANYFSVSAWLASVMESVELQNNYLKTDYDIWHSEKFITERNRLNEGITAKSKFASTAEIESAIITNYTNDYREWQNKLSLAQRREGFYRRLCQNFSTQGNMLVQLAQSQRSEMYALSVENRANKDITSEALMRKVPIKKVKTMKQED